MKEVTFQKRRTKNYAKIVLWSFETSLEHEKLEAEKKLLRLIEIQLNKHGWYKTKW